MGVKEDMEKQIAKSELEQAVSKYHKTHYKDQINDLKTDPKQLFHNAKDASVSALKKGKDAVGNLSGKEQLIYGGIATAISGIAIDQIVKNSREKEQGKNIEVFDSKNGEKVNIIDIKDGKAIVENSKGEQYELKASEVKQLDKDGKEIKKEKGSEMETAAKLAIAAGTGAVIAGVAEVAIDKAKENSQEQQQQNGLSR